jgi:hypothetical protein
MHPAAFRAMSARQPSVDRPLDYAGPDIDRAETLPARSGYPLPDRAHPSCAHTPEALTGRDRCQIANKIFAMGSSRPRRRASCRAHRTQLPAQSLLSQIHLRFSRNSSPQPAPSDTRRRRRRPCQPESMSETRVFPSHHSTPRPSPLDTHKIRSTPALGQ